MFQSREGSRNMTSEQIEYRRGIVAAAIRGPEFIDHKDLPEDGRLFYPAIEVWIQTKIEVEWLGGEVGM